MYKWECAEFPLIYAACAVKILLKAGFNSGFWL